MDYKNIITPERFREKQRKLYEELGSDLKNMPVKKDSYWKLEGELVLCFMKCAKCKQDKERNIDNYVASHVVKKDIEAWFKHYKAGCESLKNGEKSPCKDCKAKLSNESRTNNPTEFLRALKNKNINKMNMDDFMKLWEGFEYTAMTCIPKKYLVPSMNHQLAPSVYNVNDKLVFDLTVIQSQSKIKVEDLQNIYSELYKAELENQSAHSIRSDKKYCDEIQAWYDRSVVENGVKTQYSVDKAKYYRECSAKHLKTMLCVMVGNHKKDDKEAKREPGTATSSDYLKVLLDNRMRCSVSNIRLTIQKGLYTDVSIDRIDNEQSHNVGNLRPISIVFQAPGKRQITRKQFLHMCLVQNAHPVTLGAKRRIQAEHDALKEQDCPFCTIDKNTG